MIAIDLCKTMGAYAQGYMLTSLRDYQRSQLGNARGERVSSAENPLAPCVVLVFPGHQIGRKIEQHSFSTLLSQVLLLPIAKREDGFPES